MNLTTKIKKLCEQNDITIAALERTLNLGNSTIRRWETNSPSVDKLKLVADYFHVSLDELTETGLTTKDQKDIAKDLENLMSDLELNENSPLFYGESIDETDKALLKNALENALTIIKIKNKDKYTPHKHRQ